MVKKHVGRQVWLIAIVLVAGLAVASEQKDPTPEMIEKAMTPTKENVGANPPTLKVRTEKNKIAVGTRCTFCAELHNTGSRDLVVYMPGLIGYVAFDSDRKNLVPDEYGPPLIYGRGANRNGRSNFVVLRPGDYYGRSFTWRAPDPGKVVFSFSYKNADSGKTFGLQAWTGKLAEVKSSPVRIVGGPSSGF